MSGVIDADGTQWEHCNVCGEFVCIDELLYESKSEKYRYGLDLCSACVDLDEAARDQVRQRVHNEWISERVAMMRSNGWIVDVHHGRLRLLGPIKPGDRVRTRHHGDGRVTMIDESSDRVYVRRDDNTTPVGERGCVEVFKRDTLVSV